MVVPPAFSVIVPTRNERGNVPRLIAALRLALADLDYEILFVDDSTDGTDAALAEVSRDDARVVVHHREQGNGLAGAVVVGFGLSRGETIGVLDADLQHPPEVLPVLLRRLDETGADIAVASRYLPGAGSPGLSPWRRSVSQAMRLLTWAMLSGARRSSDPLSGYFVVRRSVLEDVSLRPVGFKILLEILARGRYRRVAEVPYVFGERAAGHTKARLREGLALFRHIALLVAGSPSDSRLWKFLLVGASGVVVNMAVFWLMTQPLRVHHMRAGAVAGLLSTLSNFLLNNAFTWADRRERALSVLVGRMARYYIATWGGYTLYLGLLWVLTHLGLIPMVANLLAIGIGGMLNFLVHNLWTWRRQET